MKYKKIFKEIYKAVQSRGLIDDSTKNIDFIEKLAEEFNEVKMADSEQNEVEEVIDLMTVCLNYCIHNGINLKEALLQNLAKNKFKAIEFKTIRL